MQLVICTALMYACLYIYIYIYVCMYVLHIIIVCTYITYIVCTYIYIQKQLHTVCYLYMYVRIYPATYVLQYHFSAMLSRIPWAYLKPQKCISSNSFAQPSILSKNLMLFRKHLKFNHYHCLMIMEISNSEELQVVIQFNSSMCTMEVVE